MSVTKEVQRLIAESEDVVDFELQGALRDAERMADEFSNVKPVPYIVPIERFAGLPIVGEHKLRSD